MRFSVISHVWNEEKLLPHWLLHHEPLFDRIIIIDHNSTDSTRQILEDFQLESDKEVIIVPSQLSDFNAYNNDQEVMEIEKKYYQPDQAFFVLNTTEFMWATDFRQKMEAHWARIGPNRAFGVGSIIMVDKEPNEEVQFPFYRDRHHGFLDVYPGVRRKRYFHNNVHGEYGLGRHHTGVPAEDIFDVHLLYLAFSPWPLVTDRKLAIQTRIPQSDKDMNAGKEHILTPESLEARYQEYLAQSSDLLTLPQFAEPYFRNLEN